VWSGRVDLDVCQVYLLSSYTVPTLLPSLPWRLPKIIFILNRYVITSLVMCAIFEICPRACLTNILEWQVGHNSWVLVSRARRQPPDGIHSNLHLLSTSICEYSSPTANHICLSIFYSVSVVGVIYDASMSTVRLYAHKISSCDFHYNIAWWVRIQLQTGCIADL
jgi:hypothetical protein